MPEPTDPNRDVMKSLVDRAIENDHSQRSIGGVEMLVMAAVDKIGDPLMKHIVEEVNLPEDKVKSAVRFLVERGILRMKEHEVDHDWSYRRV